MEQDIQPVSATELVQMAEQLSPSELDRLAQEVATLRARRNAPVLPTDESALFAIINQGLPEAERLRLTELAERRYQERLTDQEHRELLELQQRLESIHVARMKALAQLAQLRGVSLAEVMEQLGIQFPDHA
jgi:uncharacterized protein YfkK (UPF0435 family)